MLLRVRKFYELSAEELYAILKLRVNVFVVEQNCPYPELDDRDQEAVHIWLEDRDGIHAYLRIMDRGAERSCPRASASQKISFIPIRCISKHRLMPFRFISHRGLKLSLKNFSRTASRM